MRSPLLGFEKPMANADPFKNTPEQTMLFNPRRKLKIVEGDLWDEEWFIGLPEEGNSSNSSLFQLSSSIEKTERSAISVVLASHAIIFLPSNLSFPGWQRGMYIKWRILWTAGKNRHPFCVFLPRWNLFELAYHLSCAVMDFCALDYSTDLTIQ